MSHRSHRSHWFFFLSNQYNVTQIPLIPQISLCSHYRSIPSVSSVSPSKFPPISHNLFPNNNMSHRSHWSHRFSFAAVTAEIICEIREICVSLQNLPQFLIICFQTIICHTDLTDPTDFPLQQTFRKTKADMNNNNTDPLLWSLIPPLISVPRYRGT